MTTTIVPTIETSNNELVVSSEQIAIGAGVEHRATLQLIKTNQAELEEFGQVAFEMRAGYNNAQVRVALLNEPQAMLLMTFQRNTAQVKQFKVALIKEFKRLATQQVTPTGPELFALALVEAQQMLTAKDATIAELAPKADKHDAFLSADGAHSLADAAKIITQWGHEVGQNRLAILLVRHGFLYRDAKKRLHAYQPYVEQKLFKQVFEQYKDPETGETMNRTAPKITITSKGIDRIMNRIFPEQDAA